MRHRAEWMNKATDPVLELLEESDLAISRAIYFNLKDRADVSEATANRAISELQDRAFIKKPKNSKTYYAITERGRAYLQGDIDASEIE